MRLEIEIEITIADKGAQNGTDFVGFIIGVSTGTCAGVHWKSLTTLVRYGGYEVGWIWGGGGVGLRTLMFTCGQTSCYD